MYGAAIFARDDKVNLYICEFLVALWLEEAGMAEETDR